MEIPVITIDLNKIDQNYNWLSNSKMLFQINVCLIEFNLKI